MKKLMLLITVLIFTSQASFAESNSDCNQKLYDKTFKFLLMYESNFKVRSKDYRYTVVTFENTDSYKKTLSHLDYAKHINESIKMTVSQKQEFKMLKKQFETSENNFRYFANECWKTEANSARKLMRFAINYGKDVDKIIDKLDKIKMKYELLIESLSETK